MENLLNTQGSEHKDDNPDLGAGSKGSRYEQNEIETMEAEFSFDNSATANMANDEVFHGHELDSFGTAFCEPEHEPTPELIWDIMQLGLDEPLPILEVLDEL